MIAKIYKSSPELVAAAFKGGDFSEVDKIDAAAFCDVAKIFSSVSSGAVPVVWYDMPPVVLPGVVSVMRYALHRSTRRPEALQLSVMEIRNGALLPTSHREFDSIGPSGVRDFFNELPEKIIFHLGA